MGKFDEYRIDLKGIQATPVEYNYLLDSIFFAHIDGQEVQKGRVKAKVVVRKTAGAYELNFHTEGFVWVQCDRCLDEMEQPISGTDKLMVKFGKEYGEEGDNLIVVPEEEGAINIAWFIYEFIALAVPMKHIHAPGKCNKTMTGRLAKHLRTAPGEEEEDQGTEYNDPIEIAGDEDTAQAMDPRWNELINIIDN